MRLNNLPGTSITVEARVLFHYLEISVSDHGSSSVEDNLVTVLEAFGVGTAFRHQSRGRLGAIDSTTRPRLHPKSDDVLKAGRVLKLILEHMTGSSEVF